MLFNNLLPESMNMIELKKRRTFHSRKFMMPNRRRCGAFPQFRFKFSPIDDIEQRQRAGPQRSHLIYIHSTSLDILFLPFVRREWVAKGESKCHFFMRHKNNK